MAAPLRFYNTRSKSKEFFTPRDPQRVTIYTCGPTVYGYQHIGNYRAALTPDLLTRVLRLHAYTPYTVSNITDVGHLTADDVAQGDRGEDKIAKAAHKEGKDPYEIARFYENCFVTDTRALHIAPPDVRPRATEHIAGMIALIEKLIAHGHAYVANGNVFFDITSFPAYGTLSGNTLAQLKIGARLEEPHPDKRHQWDFALWLAAPPEHIMKWTSPWSVGYPGWHIECSAMSMQYLGDTIDFHLGGEDNIFPHHEAEIAQSECATKQPFVRYWLHTRHILIDGAKMSKSKGNIYTLHDIVARGYEPEDLRMLYLLSHYRSQMNFTWDALAQAAKNRKALLAATERIAQPNKKTTGHMLDTETFLTTFRDAVSNDLNTPAACAALFGFLTEINTALDHDGITNLVEVRATLEEVNTILGFTLTSVSAPLPSDIATLVAARDTARAARDWTAADAARDRLIAAGYIVTDTPAGTSVKRE